MSTDLRQQLTAAYADVSLGDPVDQVVRRGRRIRRARQARRVAPALVAAAAAVVVGVTVDRGGTPTRTPGPVELVGYAVPAFPLSLADVPAGLSGPSLSLDPSFERVGPGAAHAAWSDPDDPASGVGLGVRDAEPEGMGDEVADVSVDGEDATVYRAGITGAGPQFSVVWERGDGQWVTVSGSGRFASRAAVVEVAEDVVDEPVPVPLQVGVAPRGWVVVAYKDDRILTLADPAGPPATEALARTLSVSLPPAPSAPADLPAEVGAVGGRIDEVTVQGRPAQLLPTASGWYLQATTVDGTVFVLQAPGDFTVQQVVGVADGVSHPR
jgi:hypothetical protein